MFYDNISSSIDPSFSPTTDLRMVITHLLKDGSESSIYGASTGTNPAIDLPYPAELSNFMAWNKSDDSKYYVG